MYTQKRITKLTLENGDKTFTWETPYNDADLYEDILQAFYTLLIGIGYTPSTVLCAMRDFYDEYICTTEQDKEESDTDIDNDFTFKPSNTIRFEPNINTSVTSINDKFITTTTTKTPATYITNMSCIDESGYSCGGGFVEDEEEQ